MVDEPARNSPAPSETLLRLEKMLVVGRVCRTASPFSSCTITVIEGFAGPVGLLGVAGVVGAGS